MVDSPHPVIEWLAERRLAPSGLMPSIELPVGQGSFVSLFISPALDRRDQGEWVGQLTFPKGYEIPCTLFAEELTADDARRLSNALILIKSVHGLSDAEGLAFMGQWFLAFVDSARLQNETGELLLSLPPVGCFDLSNEQDAARYMEEVNRPRFKVNQVLALWDLIGAQVTAARVFDSPDGQLGRPNYRLMPPAWLTPEHVKKYKLRDDDGQVPVLVSTQLAEVTARFAEFQRALIATGLRQVFFGGVPPLAVADSTGEPHALVDPMSSDGGRANLILDFQPRFPWWCPDFPNQGQLYARVSAYNESTVAAQHPRVRLLSITPDPLLKNHLPADLMAKGGVTPQVVNPRSDPLHWDIFWTDEGTYHLATLEWFGVELMLQPEQDYIFEIEVSAANAPANTIQLKLRLDPTEPFPQFQRRTMTVNVPDGPPRLPSPPVSHRDPPLGTEVPPSPVAAAPNAPRLIFARRGDTWDVGQRGRTHAIRHVKGLTYISYLIRNPNRDIPVLELVSLVEGNAKAKVDVTAAIDDAGLAASDRSLPAADAESLRAYEADMRDHIAAIASAVASGDATQADVLRGEFAILAKEVQKLKNSQRRVEGTRADKARSNVSHQVSTAIRRIGKYDDEFAGVLRASIRTGLSCSFRTQSSHDWET